MARSAREILVRDRSPAVVWPIITSWLGRNAFKVLAQRSDGSQQVISHWDGALLVRPRLGSCVALQEWKGGGAIVLELTSSQVNGSTSLHVEGYVTGRGPGWKGKEFDFIPRNLAIAGVARRQGLRLLEDLELALVTQPSPWEPRVSHLQSRTTLPSAPDGSSRRCTQCGEVIAPAARFCGSCGAPVFDAPSARIVGSPALGTTPLLRPAGPPTPLRPLGTVDIPSLPLLPNETIEARYASSQEGQSQVVGFSMLVALVIVVAVIVPVAVVLNLSQGLGAVAAVALLPILLMAGLALYLRRTIRNKAPTTVVVTNRRVLVSKPGKDGASAAMALENVGRVEVDFGLWALRRAGVAWVYILPTGAPSAMIGSGRARHAAPGVLWVPAVPIEQANLFKSSVTAAARSIQARLGYPEASLAQ